MRNKCAVFLSIIVATLAGAQAVFAGDYGTVTVGNQSTNIVPGGSATFPVTLSGKSGGNSVTVALTITGLPTGASGSFVSNNFSSSISATSSVLTVTTTGSALPGSYTFTVTDNSSPSGTGTLKIGTNTTTTVTSSGNPFPYGSSVAFTATVTAISGTPSGGTVTFKDGVTSMGTATLSGSGKAIFTTNRLSVAGSPHSITAVYAGNGSFGGSTSSAFSESVNAASLTVSGVTAATKPYDGTTNATLNTGGAALVGIVSGDSVTLNTGGASGEFAGKNVGTGKVVTVSGLTITGTDSGNYTLTQPTATGTISTRAITVTAATDSKVYDASTSSTGTPSVTTGSLVTGDIGNFTQSFTNKTVGTGKALVPTGSVGDGNSGLNYIVTFTNNNTGAITAKSLTVTATGVNKVYDATTTASVTLLDNRILGDTFTDSYASALFADKNVGTGKPISVTGISISGTDAGNYTANTNAATLASITTLSVTGSITASNKVYDGTMAAAIASYGLSGVLSNDAVTLGGGTANFSDKNVGNSKTVNATSLSISGGDAGNYALASSSVTTTANITAASLTVTADSKSRPYAQPNPPFTASYTGFVGGDNTNVLSGAPLLGSTADSNSVAGSYTITVTNGALSAQNYGFSFVNGTLTIGKAVLTVTANDQSRTYGATNPVLTVAYSGFLDGDDTNVLTGAPLVTTLADTNSSVAGSPYGITVTNGTLTATNYNFAFVSGSLTVTPAVVTVTVDNQTVVYGTTLPVFTASYSGFVNGEDTNVLTGSPDLSTAALANSPVAGNPYTIAVTNGTLSADNYTFSFVDGQLNITPATLTGSITASNKVYDGTAAAGIASYGLSGVISNDAVSLGGGTASFNGKNIGTNKTVTATGLTLGGADSGNYTLASSTANTTASITPAALTVSAQGIGKAYDATTAATVTLSDNHIGSDNIIDAYTSAAFGDKNVGVGKTVSVTGISISGADAGNYTANTAATTSASITALSVTGSITASNKVYDGTTVAVIASYGLSGVISNDAVTLGGGTANFSDKNVGAGKSVTATGLVLSGGDSVNYALASSSASTTADITLAALTVTADNKSRPYAQPNPGFTASYSGFASGDDTNVLLGAPDLSTTADTNSATGSYTITVTNGTLSAQNYSFSFVDGTLTIGKAVLTVTADDQSRTYGGTNPVLTVAYSGFVNGDDANILTGAPLVSTEADTNSTVVGSPYAIAVTNGTLTATNYDFAFISGSLTVTPAVVTVMADNQTAVYGTTLPVFTASYSAFVNGEDTNVLSGVPDLSTTALATSPVAGNPYTIMVTNGTLSADNYTFSFVDGQLNITPATLTGSITASNKVYDGTTAAAIASYGLNGVISNDVVSLMGGTSNFSDKNVGNGKTVTATGLTLTGADSGNYTLVSDGATAFANISAAALTVSAQGVDKVYDDTTLATVTLSDNRIAGDNFTETYTGATFGDKNVGVAKPVGVIGIAISGGDAGNYTANTTASASASITVATVTGSITASNKVYDGTTVAAIASYGLSGVISNDAVTLGGGTANFSDPNVGSGKTVTATGLSISSTDSGNYALASTGASTTASITAASLTISADNKEKTSGLLNPTLTASYNGFVNSEDASVLSTPANLSTTATDASPAGTYPITASGAAAANYTISYTPGTMNVVPVPQLTSTVLVGGQFSFTFATISNESYQIEFKSALTNATWADLGGPMNGTEGLVSVTNSVAGMSGFFKVEIAPVP